LRHDLDQSLQGNPRAIGLRPDRNVVIAEEESFPTDLYIIEGAMSPRVGRCSGG